MQTENIPSLTSLGITATIEPAGIRSMQDGGEAMCAWICTFSRGSQVEQFDFFTGHGLGAEWPVDLKSNPMLARELTTEESIVFNSPPSKRWSVKDKRLLCGIAHAVNRMNGWAPDPVEVLWSIAREGDALDLTFEDWCLNLGWDADSRRAEKIYKTCQSNLIRLKRILSNEQIQTLAALEL